MSIDINTLAEVIHNESDPDLDIVYDDARKGDTEHTRAEISKANGQLGYEPTVSIPEDASQSSDTGPTPSDTTR